MVAVFCLRLAAGMLGCLLLLTPDVGPAVPAARATRVGFRFYRTHFLTALGLACVAVVFLHETAPAGLLALLIAGMVLAVAGSVAWALEGAPGGRALIVLTTGTLAAALVWQEVHASPAAGWSPGFSRSGAEDRLKAELQPPVAGAPLAARLAGDLTSAALLGSALTAMLLGHSYLISPSLSIRPLMRLLAALALAVVARAAADGYALVRWTAEHSLGSLNTEETLWLPVRWLVGFVAPLALTWMAWQAARIRSTQSATGILYVVVIFCFLGELMGLLLRQGTTTL
jgi:hypothetical protein